MHAECSHISRLYRRVLLCRRLQIITVNETGDGFTLHEQKIAFVLKQIPADMKVSIVSVVGAFRTGKSFLLDMFLRYLRYYDEHPDGA
jgi:atlastin